VSDHISAHQTRGNNARARISQSFFSFVYIVLWRLQVRRVQDLDLYCYVVVAGRS
jgi:hypothetical protein